MPVRHYCTLFDRNYLLRGLALYRSLERYGRPFVLHVLCMDDTVYELFDRMALPGVRLIRRADFEDPELLAVKPTRTVAEYCWTCTPSLPLYVLEHNSDLELITYVDADLFFFSSPEPIFEEFGDGSILIVEHRFSPHFAHFSVNGKYNVEWLTFRRDSNALGALRWWREKCIEWCFYRLEEDRMGDQKYLDTWPSRFDRVHVLNHIGAGLAPWNCSNYRIAVTNDRVLVNEVDLIFYHFHGFRYLMNDEYIATGPMYLKYEPLPEQIYELYRQAIRQSLTYVRQFENNFSFGVEPVYKTPLLGSVATRMYWALPEWGRDAFRKMISPRLRGRMLSALGLADHQKR